MQRGSYIGPPSNSITAVLRFIIRAKSFTYVQQHFSRGRMIMSAQSSSATPRSTTAAETGNTPHPSVKHCADKVNARYIHGRPGSELVPSRYALRVGEIDVMVISDGVLSLPGAMFGHNVDPAVRAAWLKRHVSASRRARVGTERGHGAQRRPDHTHRRWDGDGVPGLAAVGEVGPATGGRRHRSRIRDRRGADSPAHGPLWRAARRRRERAAAS